MAVKRPPRKRRAAPKVAKTPPTPIPPRPTRFLVSGEVRITLEAELSAEDLLDALSGGTDLYDVFRDELEEAARNVSADEIEELKLKVIN